MKSFIILLFVLLPAGSAFSQKFIVDITNHPDSGIDCHNKRLAEQKIKSVDREEYFFIEKEKLIHMGTHTYKINKDGDIFEEIYSEVNGDIKKYSYKYDHRGNVIEKKEYQATSNKGKEFSAVKHTRFFYTYDYDGCLNSVTLRSGRYSYKDEYSCGFEGNKRIFTRHNNAGDTVLKYDLYNNLIEETALSPLTNQEIKKNTYHYTYNKDMPVKIVKTSGQCIYTGIKSTWKYTLESTQCLLYDDNGNVKSILFLDSNNKPFKMFKYLYKGKDS